MWVRLRISISALACATVSLVAVNAWGWGATGHRLIGRAAIAALPGDAPEFLRDPATIDAVGELAREPDRWKDSGKAHDGDRDPAHFLDLGDDGKIFGGPALSALPESRAAYDAAVRAAGADSWKSGYLPFAIIDSWQQLTKDFAYWRVDKAAAAATKDPIHRAWFEADLAGRRWLILRDLGVLAHYVGDGSQPLHVTVHFNGWGPWPNPAGYTQARIHAGIEGEFVHRLVSQDDVTAAIAPIADCACAITVWTAAYLSDTNRYVVPLYDLQKDGGFAGDDARGRRFVAARLGAGASALRDLIMMAWRNSATSRVGWPAVNVADVEAGMFDPFDSIYGAD